MLFDMVIRMMLNLIMIYWAVKMSDKIKWNMVEIVFNKNIDKCTLRIYYYFVINYVIAHYFYSNLWNTWNNVKIMNSLSINNVWLIFILGTFYWLTDAEGKKYFRFNLIHTRPYY